MTFSHYDNLRRIDRLGGSLAQRGRLGIRRITDRLTGKKKAGSAVLRALTADLPAPDAVRNLLVVKLWGLGNMVLAGRALRSLRTAFTRARITVLTTTPCQAVYERNDLADEWMAFDPEREGGLGTVVRDLCTQLQERRFDVAVNLEGLSELARLMTQHAGAAATVGMVAQEKELEGGVYAASVLFDPAAHAEDLMMECARRAGGVHVVPGLVRPAVGAQERGVVEEALGRFALDPHALLIGINVNASNFGSERRWPAEKFAHLAQQLEAHEEFRTVFLGGPGEARRVEQVLKLMEHPGLSVAGLFSVRQTMALLEQLHLLVTVDSGPLHLAAALGVPTVAIFGPESPTRVGRRDAEEHAAVYHAIPCSPCLSMLGMASCRCQEGARCVRDIAVEEVHHLVCDMLDHLSDPEDPPWLAKG